MKANFHKAERERPDVVATLCNGCGPGGLSRIIPDFDEGYRRVCFKHDWEFTEGGTVVDFFRANFKFSGRLLLRVVDYPWWSWFWMIPLTKVYFLAVALLGWPAFHWAWKPRTHEEMIQLAEKIQQEEMK